MMLLPLLLAALLLPSAQTSQPLTLQQVWSLNAAGGDAQHGVTFRYPSVWQPAAQLGYMGVALASSGQSRPPAGWAFSEGSFPRTQVVGPYTSTNLETVGFLYSVVPVANAGACAAKAALLAAGPRQRSTAIAGRTFSVYRTADAGMSHSVAGKLYATYSTGSCYLFETSVATVSPGVVDNIRALTSQQIQDIDLHLWNLMQTVRIVAKQ